MQITENKSDGTDEGQRTLAPETGTGRDTRRRGHRAMPARGGTWGLDDVRGAARAARGSVAGHAPATSAIPPRSEPGAG